MEHGKWLWKRRVECAAVQQPCCVATEKKKTLKIGRFDARNVQHCWMSWRNDGAREKWTRIQCCCADIVRTSVLECTPVIIVIVIHTYICRIGTYATNAQCACPPFHSFRATQPFTHWGKSIYCKSTESWMKISAPTQTLSHSRHSIHSFLSRIMTALSLFAVNCLWKHHPSSIRKYGDW